MNHKFGEMLERAEWNVHEAKLASISSDVFAKKSSEKRTCQGRFAREIPALNNYGNEQRTRKERNTKKRRREHGEGKGPSYQGIISLEYF